MSATNDCQLSAGMVKEKAKILLVTLREVLSEVNICWYAVQIDKSLDIS
jgi:hypothetical protein